MKNYKKELQTLTFITQNQIFSLLAQNKQNPLPNRITVRNCYLCQNPQ